MKPLVYASLLISLFLMWHACASEDETPAEQHEINLRWVKAYPGESRSDVISGLRWAFSFLGAELPKGSMEKAVVWQTETQCRVDVSELGFSKAATTAFADIFVVLSNSEEYSRFNAIDVGRFLLITLNASNHYYALTGVSPSYNAFRSRFRFDEKRALVINSTVAFGSRVIEMSEVQNALDIAFVATEGTGSVYDGSFKAVEFEVIDVMPNGQLRFAIYDRNGELKTASSPELTIAGKPAKCAWCHETSLLPPIIDDHQAVSYYSTDEFKEKIQAFMHLLTLYRSTLLSDLDFSEAQEHTRAELLYLSFMEPSAERLAVEWGTTAAEVKNLLRGVPTHGHSEFSFLGDSLYFRKDVAPFATFKDIPLPENARDFSPFEPDFVN